LFFAACKQLGWSFFRACVALRRILAARRKPVIRSARRAAVIAVLATSGTLAAGQDMSQPAGGEVRAIGQLGTDTSPPTGELPPDAAEPYFHHAPVFDAGVAGRPWQPYAYFWQPTALYHKPLYFEQPNVERYGHRARFGLQPAISGAHFLGSTLILPAKMALRPPHFEAFTLGYGRPGSNVGWQIPW
jgi:hypothetical protein